VEVERKPSHTQWSVDHTVADDKPFLHGVFAKNETYDCIFNVLLILYIF